MISWMLLAVTVAAGQVDADGPVVIVVIGAEGQPEYGRAFAAAANQWEAAARRGGARFKVIGHQPVSGVPDREQLSRLLDQQQPDARQGLWLVLVGHGTYDGRAARFNLRGPDVAAEELAAWLAPLSRPVAVINCASSSGPFIERLARPGRIVVTATRSGSEQNATRYGDFLARAIGEAGADLDKDGQTSLLEAHLAACRGVEESYRLEGRLATEHALLDDNGDGRGTPADWFQGVRVKQRPDQGVADGMRAHQWHLVRSDAERRLPADAAYRRDQLELEIAALRERKHSLSPEEYDAELEVLLVELAEIYEAADSKVLRVAGEPAEGRVLE